VGSAVYTLCHLVQEFITIEIQTASSQTGCNRNCTSVAPICEQNLYQNVSVMVTILKGLNTWCHFTPETVVFVEMIIE
jgi:hypothetical protein